MDLLQEGTGLEGLINLYALKDLVDEQFVVRLLTYKYSNGYGIKIFRKKTTPKERK